MEIRQARTLHKIVKIFTMLNDAKKLFLTKFFIPLIKGKVSTKFEAISGKLKILTEIRQTHPLQK